MTKEEARQHPIKVNYPLFTCAKCKKEACNDANNYILKNHEMCWSCNYWIEVVAESQKPDTSLLVIGGTIYSDDGWSNGRKDFLGFAGRIFNYRRLPDGLPMKTNNLWGGGIIPEIWRDLLPDNAEWTDHKREWVKIGNGQIALANIIIKED